MNGEARQFISTKFYISHEQTLKKLSRSLRFDGKGTVATEHGDQNKDSDAEIKAYKFTLKAEKLF